MAAKKGDYHDALTVKKNTVVALIASPSGGVTRHTHGTLVRWSKEAAQGRDATVYGLYETKGAFYTHHAAAISMAAVRRESEALNRGVTSREFRRTHPGLFMAGPATAHM